MTGLQNEIQQLVETGDYAGAAVLKAKIVVGKGVAGVPRDKQETTTTITALLHPSTVVRTMVRLEKVRLLSIGKRTSIMVGAKDQWAIQQDGKFADAYEHLRGGAKHFVCDSFS